MSERAESFPLAGTGPPKVGPPKVGPPKVGPAEAGLAQVGLAALFVNFAAAGLCGFGGVMPWARRMIVEQRRWLSPAEFNDLLALCQFLPGPNVVNLSVALGLRFQGPVGAAVAFTGLLAGPVAVVTALGALYARLGQIPEVRHALAGLAAAASGLVLSMALRIAAPLRGQALAMALAAVAFVAIALLRLPLLPTMLVLAPAGVLLSWWRAR